MTKVTHTITRRPKKTNRTIKTCCLILLAGLFVCVVVFFWSQKIPQELDPNRIALIAVVGNNYIFRGNNPFVTKDKETVFAYHELTSYFNNILSQQDRNLLQDYYLVDVSLLDLDEYYTMKKEEQFFAKHPDRGRVMNISTLSPSLLFKRSPHSNRVTQQITERYSLWVTNTLKQIQEMASRQTDKPIIIYIHCNAGRDRTGFIVAGYKLLFHNVHLSGVRLQNVAESGRNSEGVYEQAIYSYCLHVKQVYNKSNDYCD
ncbi:MAG: tyrosine-protein phosphatase [Nitrospirae bacterium]|nr:tyrosine-protein phosphatase [Candidatus Troglogloeales bacterium]